MEFDWLLEDRGASRGFVLCPETILGHHAVAEGWDLERQEKGATLTTAIKPASSPERQRNRSRRSLSATALTERKAWTMSALIELSGLSRIITKICSSFSRLMKLPNQDLLASLKIRDT